MNNDMPWVTGLTDEEVEQLRNNKKQLTDEGMRKIRELMRNQVPYPDEMFEEAERREAANKKELKEELEAYRFVKNPDEIVLEDVKMVHYETMEEGRAVWIGIYLNNGKMYHLNIGGDNLYVNYSDESDDY